MDQPGAFYRNRQQQQQFQPSSPLAASYSNEAKQRRPGTKLGAAVSCASNMLLRKALRPLNAAMRGFLNELGDPRKLRDAEYVSISEFCENHGFKEYGQRPRTLVLLSWAGCPEAIEGFVHEKLSDMALPYNDRILPLCVKGPMRAKFLELQDLVLAEQLEILEREGGEHLNVKNAESWFRFEKRLGSGGFGHVHHVITRYGLRQYALKCIDRGSSFEKDRRARLSFEKELRTLKKLSHKHLVKLIGSYTDRNHIGLLMLPIADMNLATYLAKDDVCGDRAECLRVFHGCLAAAVEYLHSQKIRHKDIKPQNVLVIEKYQRVLLADFGTSHNWDDDGNNSSSGTSMEAFTPRYCAPEIRQRMRRNEASDVFSLGCIFLEMSSVMAGYTVQQMQEFFTQNGNGKEYIGENPDALKDWRQCVAVRLAQNDHQVLDLGMAMCEQQPIDRPTAGPIVSKIVDFSGPQKYHCGCCEVKTDLWEKLNVTEDLYAITKTEDEQLGVESMSEGQEKIRVGNYANPRVQEVQDDFTVIYYDSFGEPVCQKRESNISETLANTASQSNDVTILGNAILTPSLSYLKSNTLSPTEQPISIVTCQWPSCNVGCSIDGNDPLLGEILHQHYRRFHGCHEFGCSTLIQLLSSAGTQQSLNLVDNSFVLVSEASNTIQNEPDPIVQQILSTKVLRKQDTAHSILLRSKTRTERESSGRKSSKKVRFGSVSSRSLDSSPDQVDSLNDNLDSQSLETSADTGEQSAAVRSDQSSRFEALPRDRRPEPAPINERQVSFEENFDLNEPLEEPRLQAWWPNLDLQPYRNDPTYNILPSASFVPSFHLAASNSFNDRDIAQSTDSGQRNLFVYGTLMFPSVLRACAQFFVSDNEGIYSEELQRRLRTTSKDWNYIDMSVQHAAERMTPAAIPSYLRRGLRTELPNAHVVPSSNKSQVHGFLVLGVSPEAFRCLDHWHKHVLKNSQDSKLDVAKRVHDGYGQETVSATIQAGGGSLRVLEATMFVSSGVSAYNRKEWDINRFVKSPAFTTLSKAPLMKSGSELFNEERRLAAIMKMRCLMSGDLLAHLAFVDDERGVLDCIASGHDVNASCQKYGTALQAVASTGNLAMTRLLIQEGADVNATGGKYSTALIAASREGRYWVARELLRSRADVLASGGKYVNALYQAVSFCDIKLAQMLLEKGAWLCKSYGEILDLAEENGNRNMICMLQDYDVRGLHKRQAATEMGAAGEAARDIISSVRSRSRSRSDTDMVYISYNDRLAMSKPKSSFLRAVLTKAFELKGQEGKWTGIKLVKVLQTALSMGLPDDKLDAIPGMWHSYTEIVEYLSEVGREMADGKGFLGKLNGSNGNRGPIEGLLALTANPRNASPRRHSSPSSESPRWNSRTRRQSESRGPVPVCRICDDAIKGAETDTCQECDGRGSIWQKSGAHSRRLTCPTCSGARYSRSRTDICANCNRSRQRESSQRTQASFGSDFVTQIDEDGYHDDPPPAYDEC